MFRGFLQDMAPQFNCTIPFLVCRGVNEGKVQILADMARASNLGFGCIFSNQWAQGSWSDTNLFTAQCTPNIALLELLAIVTAFEIWASEVSTSEVTLRSDNAVTVAWISIQKSDIPAAKQLLEKLILTCLFFQIHVKIQHIEGKSNEKSDLVSRFCMQEFFPQICRDVHNTQGAPRGMAAILESRKHAPPRQTVGQKIQNKECIKILKEISLPEVEYLIAVMPATKHKTLEYYAVACREAEIPLNWGHLQLHTFLAKIDKLYYSASQIKMMWKLIRDMSKKLKFVITQEDIMMYNFVLAQCKPTKDDKLPVTRELLKELCYVALRVLQAYDAKMAWAIFLCAFGGFMRCSEYTAARPRHQSHNIHDDAIHITDDGIGIAFWSDKCSYLDPSPKDRIIS